MQMPEEKAETLIREAEAAKTRIFDTPGKEFLPYSNEFIHTGLVDEKFLCIGAHLEEGLRQEIVTGQYVDFARLLPKEKSAEDENRLELLHKDGHTYWVPAGDLRSGNIISNFAKWEQAFRIFANVYTKRHPHKSSELLQYSHIIHTASQSYMWENVYAYDKDFRMHLSEFPQRMWGIILQQSWSLRLKDKIKHSQDSLWRPSNQSHEHDYCKCHNRGYCSYGLECRYKHRCLYCHKYGHGFANCRKAQKKRRREKMRNDREGSYSPR